MPVFRVNNRKAMFIRITQVIRLFWHVFTNAKLGLKGREAVVKITNIYHINITYVFHFLFSINVGNNVTKNAISDFLTIQNTSGGQCCTAQYRYCLQINPDI